MRYLIVIPAIVLFSLPAAAAERSNLYTTEQINSALRSLGRCCEIGTARVLYDDKAGVTRSEIKIQSNRPVNYNIGQ